MPPYFLSDPGEGAVKRIRLGSTLTGHHILHVWLYGMYPCWFVLLSPLGVQSQGHSLSKTGFLLYVSESAHCIILWKG